jgi:hypothetical protein
MRRNALIAAVLAFAALAAPAVADEVPKPKADDQSVTLATVALPLVFDGQIVNYVFVSAKVMLTPQTDALVLRDKEPYFRDALVRVAHRTPFTRPGDYDHIDEGRLKAALYREAVAIVGPGKIAGVVVLSQTAQHRVASPHSNGGAAIVP